MEELPKNMSLSALADRCMSEINSYRRGEASSDQYSLEMFRRAMLERDNAVRALLVKCFYEYMLDLFRRHLRKEAASRIDSPENYVARAFERLWFAAVHNQQLQFTTLAAALSYLRSCLNTAILDTLRAYSRSKEEVLPEPGFPDELAVEDHKEGQDLWEIFQGLFANERERRVAYLLFKCNLKPREIVRYCSQEFSDVREIYRLRRNIMERLQRDSDQIRWQLSDSQWTRTTALTDTDLIGPDEKKALSLFALTRTILEGGDKAFIGRTYSIQAGIALSKPEKFQGESFDLPVGNTAESISFDIVLHPSENIELATDWHKYLLYDPRNPEPQLVEFTFKVVAAGHISLAVNFYHERRWLKTIRVEFVAVEQLQPTTASFKGG